MKTIPLTKGYVAIVDDADYEALAGIKWQAMVENHTCYARHNWRDPITGVYRCDLMHRVILGAKPGQVVDHINGNGLDNRRSNIRLCSIAQNNARRLAGSPAKSGYRGVSRNGKRYRATIAFNGTRHDLGTYPTPELAARAYDAAALRLHGEFARLNFQQEVAA